MKRYAAIDIGTNTILLLIVEKTSEGLPRTIVDQETTTRLGEGLVKNREINPRAMQRTIEAIERYLSYCRREGTTEVVAVGTGALREARNRSEFLRRVRMRCELNVEIISGQEEARLSHLGVVMDRKWFPGPIMVVDIGGGSTEWIYGKVSGEVTVLSMDIGALTITERFVTSDPLKEEEYRDMAFHVKKAVTEISPPKEHPPLVGIGGTITTLLAMKRGLKEFASSHIHHGLLKLRDIEEQIERLKILPLEKRRLIAGLPPERADIIMAGAMILFHSLARLGSERIWVSCQGLRHGILFDRFLP